MNRHQPGSWHSSIHPSVLAISRKLDYPVTLLLIWLASCAGLVAWSMHLAGGHLIFTLDDPYIHLALAESILQGGYGINVGEYSAPSSSILYPLILAITEWCGLAGWGPLLINLLAMGCAVYLTGGIIERHVLAQTVPRQAAEPWPAWPLLLGLLVILNMNAWALVMTGMEHSLHVLTVIMVIRGFLQCLDEDRPASPWLIVAIVAMPLIRFEGLAMALPSIALLYWLGERSAALTAGVLIALSLAGWYWFMQSLGLPLLPSSVLLKSATAATAIGEKDIAGIFPRITRNLETNLGHNLGVQLFAGLILTAILSLTTQLKRSDNRFRVAILALTLPTGSAQLVFGGAGELARYETYALILTTLSVILLIRASLGQTAVKTMAALLLLVRGYPNFVFIYLTPWASQAIYLQQYQMHRFVTEYLKQPIGVNDIGLVSYHNPSYVLDLWGQGSEEIRKKKLEKSFDSHYLAALAASKNAQFFMIYDHWFKHERPEAWKKIATLNTYMKNPMIPLAGDQVGFYLDPKLDSTRVHRLLSEFASTLPAGAALDFHDH